MTDLTFLPQGGVTSPHGFRATGVAARIKYADRLDVALVVADAPCSAAAVFTRNQVVAAPVVVDRETLATHSAEIRAVLINAGNANASTGQPGLADARASQSLVADALGLLPHHVLVMSTGVIGVPLPMDRMAVGVALASAEIRPDGGADAARAIMTTDTRPKSVAVSVEMDGGTVTVGGMAKGSGMIHPDMATMLSLVTTDAQIAPDRLHDLLTQAINVSFNRISVDGDTSTNDTVLLLANGVSEVVVSAEDEATFLQALVAVCQHLAHEIVRDGEGATKFVTITVTGTAEASDAHTIANTIAISPLVKTAFAGSDANWGRLLMAAGRAGVVFDQYEVDLWIGVETPTLQLVANGTPTGYAEADAAAIFAEPAFKIWLSVGRGSAESTVWTTDLTHDYISINADYRT